MNIEVSKNEKMNALRRMQKRHAEMTDNMYSSIDFDKEWEEALAEQYGYSAEKNLEK